MKVHVTLVASFVTLAVSSVAHAGVIVVDAAGGGSFTQIQPAVAAAVEGDTILVKPGNYSGFAINAKSLTVVGDVGTLPNVSGIVSITNLAAGQVLTIARIKAQGTGTFPQTGPALSVENCAGAVRIVGCTLTGRDGTASPVVLPGAGSQLSNSHDVAFTGCTLLGGDGVSQFTCFFDNSSAGWPGLWVNGGTAATHECVIDGGHGGNGGDYTGPGGDGVYLYTPPASSPGSFLFASRSNIHGGGGGNTDCPAYGCPSSGGSGFDIANAPSSTPDPIGWISDLMIGGGAVGTASGFGSGFDCDPAAPGQAYSGLSPFTFSAASVGFSIPAIAREGDFVTVTFTGLPGAHVFLNDELTTTFEAVASWRGVLLSPFPESLIGPARARRWGVIPSSGVLTANYRAPMLPAGEQAQTRFLQAYRVGPNGLTLGTFRTLTVLDSAF